MPGCVSLFYRMLLSKETFHRFNPAVWLVKRELQDVHEYEADASVLYQGIDAKRYQLL